VPAEGPVNNLMGADQSRRASGLLARTFGTIGFFGVVDFLAALLRGTVSPNRFVSLAISAYFCFVGILAWRETRRPMIAGKVALPEQRKE